MNILPTRDQVLIISDYSKCILAHESMKQKVVPIVCALPESALIALKHNSFFAVIIDKDHSKVDVLELILNIQDFSSDCPVFVHREATVNAIIKDKLTNVRSVINKANLSAKQIRFLGEIQSHLL